MPMADATFVSSISVFIWPTTGLQIPAGTRSIRFEGQEVDADVRVTLMPEGDTVQVTLWNIGDPARVLPTFGKNFLMAIDMAVASGDRGTGAPFRTVLCRIRNAKAVRDEQTPDIGFVISAVTIADALTELYVRANFPPDTGPYKLKVVVDRLLGLAGLGAFQVAVPDVQLPGFTADGLIFGEIRRAAAKAGVQVGIFLQGGRVTVSDTFSVGKVIEESAVFHLHPQEEADAPQAILPLESEGGFDADSVTDLALEQQPEGDGELLASGASPVTGLYEMLLPLTPDLLRGSVALVRGERLLSEAGILGVSEQAFSVLGVEHIGSSREDAEVDTTRVIMAKREVS